MKEDRHRPRGADALASISSLETRLESLSSAGVWGVLTLAVACIAAADFLVYPIHVRLGPLYLLPICLASWNLDLKAGLTVAAIGTALSLAPALAASDEKFAVVSNRALLAFSLVMMAVIVSRFRASYERERIFARRDSITGALTRRAFESQAEAMIAAAAVQDRPLLLAYLDLDGFKSVNDRHGHEAGDLVLKHFGIEGRAALRREDCFGRVGGDEFALLVPLPAIEEARETADALHVRFSAALALTAHEVTCSMGAIAIAPDRGACLDELMREADRLMYVAKRDGKDGVRFATSVLPPPVSSQPILQPPLGDASEVVRVGC